MNIPPPILEKFYNQGGDEDGDDHAHEDELGHILTGGWQLILMDHPFLSIYSPLLMLLLREQVLSPMVALSGPIPTPVAWYSGWILVC